MPSPTSPDSTRRLVVLGAVCMAALAKRGKPVAGP